MNLRKDEVLKALTENVGKQLKQHSFRTLANFIAYFSNLEYLNQELFERIERELVKRLKVALLTNYSGKKKLYFICF